MIVKLETHGLQTLELIRAFLAGSAPLSCAAPQREMAYGFEASQLGRFDPDFKRSSMPPYDPLESNLVDPGPSQSWGESHRPGRAARGS